MSAYNDSEKVAGATHTEYTDAIDEPRMPVGRYFATRFSTLKPPMAKVPNPITLLASLNRAQWLFFLVSQPQSVSSVTLHSFSLKKII